MMVALCCLDFTVVEAKTKIALEKFYESKDYEKAVQGVPVVRTMNVDESCKTNMVIFSEFQSGINIEITDSKGKLSYKDTVSSNNIKLNANLGLYEYKCDFPLKKGKKYKCRFTFSEKNNFIVLIARDGIVRKNDSSVVVTQGISNTLSTGTKKVKKWKSSNPKIVSVKNGKVVGKKCGTATVVGYVKDSYKLVWKVKVKKNIYEEKPIKLSKENKDKMQIQVYKVLYSKKKLLLKTRVLNNTGNKGERLEKIKIVVKNKEHKTIGEFECKEKKVIIKKKSYKDFVFVIKNPAIKKGDLRKAKIVTSGKVFYYE